MINLNGMPRNLELGLGRVRPCKSAWKTFFCFAVRLGASILTVAPVYNFSPSGRLLVTLQAASQKQSTRISELYRLMVIVAIYCSFGFTSASAALALLCAALSCLFFFPSSISRKRL